MWYSALLILWWERYYTEREKVKFGNMSRSQECKLVFIWIQITWFSTVLEDLFTENKLKFSTLTESYFQLQYFFVGWRTKIIIWIYIMAFLGKTEQPKSGYPKQKGNLMERLRSHGTTASLENPIWKIRSPGFLWGIRNPIQVVEPHPPSLPPTPLLLRWRLWFQSPDSWRIFLKLKVLGLPSWSNQSK